MNLTEFINTNTYLAKSDEIIFFGGSFNPWHDGHGECVERAKLFAPVIIIPDNNPFKSYDKNINRSPSINKIDQIVNDKNIFLFMGFSELKEANPTYNWIQSLKKNTNKKLSLLIGFDSFISIDRWLHAKELLNSLENVYVLSRNDLEKQKKKQLIVIKEIAPNLKINFLGNHDFENLDSTTLRSNKT